MFGLSILDLVGSDKLNPWYYYILSEVVGDAIAPITGGTSNYVNRA